MAWLVFVVVGEVSIGVVACGVDSGGGSVVVVVGVFGIVDCVCCVWCRWCCCVRCAGCVLLRAAFVDVRDCVPLSLFLLMVLVVMMSLQPWVLMSSPSQVMLLPPVVSTLLLYE